MPVVRPAHPGSGAATGVLPRLGVVLDDTARDFLEGAALARRTVRLPLTTAPEQGTLYALEVTSPRRPEPLVLLGRAAGPRAATGWPFALSRPEEVEVDADGSDPLEGRELAGGKLVLGTRIGEGGAGVVYRARHKSLRIDVAVKILHADLQSDAEFVRSFEAEALLASRLDHPNITRVLDFGQEPDGLLYLAMEFLDGVSLREVLEKEQRLALPRVVAIVSQLCSALAHAHARGLVHRDVKPENLVLVRAHDDDGHDIEQVKLCDFGIALVHSHEHHTHESSGTPDYMAPEQIAGEPPDPRNDVYACGVLVYELLCGSVPFDGELGELVAKKRAGIYPPLSRALAGLDLRVDRVVARALAVDKNDRFPNVRDLRAALRAADGDAVPASSGIPYGETPYAPSVAPRALSPSLAPPPRSSSMAPPPTRASSTSIAPPRGSSPDLLGSLVPPAPPSVRTSQPDWLESGRDYLLASVPPPSHSMPPPPERRPSMPPTLSFPAPAGSLPPAPPSSSRDLREGEARSVANVLRRLAEARAREAFAELAVELEPQIRALVAQGHATVAWRLRSTIDVIAAEPSGEGGRASEARRLLKIFYDVKLLRPIAAKALDSFEDKDRAASKLIVRAGLHGAHALYAARLANGVFDARERFVSILEEIGPATLELHRAALAKLESQLHMPGAATVVEDLLRAMPEVPNAALAELVARYARVDHAKIAPIATAAIARTAGDAGRHHLLELVLAVSDEVALAALSGLRRTGGLDARAVHTVAPIVTGQHVVKPRVRVAVAEALAEARAEGVPLAKQLCQWILVSVDGTTPEVEDLVVVGAKTFIALGGDGAYVAERWRRSASWLRTRLEAVLRDLSVRT